MRVLAEEDFRILQERYGWEEEKINQLREERDKLFNQEVENLDIKFEIEVDDKLSKMFDDLIAKQRELADSTMDWLSSLKSSNESTDRIKIGRAHV